MARTTDPGTLQDADILPAKIKAGTMVVTTTGMVLRIVVTTRKRAETREQEYRTFRPQQDYKRWWMPPQYGDTRWTRNELHAAGVRLVIP